LIALFEPTKKAETRKCEVQNEKNWTKIPRARKDEGNLMFGFYLLLAESLLKNLILIF
jgi:hypothetical protein